MSQRQPDDMLVQQRSGGRVHLDERRVWRPHTGLTRTRPARGSTTIDDKAPTSVSPDGAWAIFRDGEPQGFDISRLALLGDHRIEHVLHTPFSEQNGEVSPDGRWLAYQANDSGRAEIWVRPFADVNGGRWQVSAGGGFQPLWSPDGREIFYRDFTGGMMRVTIERGPGWAAGTPTKLFGAGLNVTSALPSG